MRGTTRCVAFTGLARGLATGDEARSTYSSTYNLVLPSGARAGSCRRLLKQTIRGAMTFLGLGQDRFSARVVLQID